MKKLLLSIGFLLVSFFSLAQAEKEQRFLTILVEFEDVRFSLDEPRSLVTDMLSLPGFRRFGATGSVADYYSDNSGGQYVPLFDVLGPVTLDKPMAAYGKDLMDHGVRIRDIAPERVIYEACLNLDDTLDYSLYDADDDGFIDLIILVYAGYDQASGGPSDALWAQQWNVQRYDDDPEVKDALFDEVKLGQYILTPELAGSTASRLAGIGPLCHELGHFLGLPDWYDTDGAEKGNAGGVYGFSLMGSGLYNNNNHTPPTLNALELSLLGWSNESNFEELPEGPVRLEAGQSYITPTGTEGEYYLYEYRNGKGWNAPLPTGLVIYHVDRTDKERWDNWREHNDLNADATHPCFYLIPSAKPESLVYDISLTPVRMVYPGLDKVLYYIPKGWDGNETGVQITNISLEDDAVCFWVLKEAGSNINGRVFDGNGQPLEGVFLALEGMEGITDVSRADGFFCLTLPPEGEETLFSLTAFKEGYLPVSEEVSLENGRMISLSLVLPAMEEASERPLSKYDKQAQLGYFSTSAILGGVRFTPEDLFPYVGQRLTEITFYPYMQASFEGDVYVVVDLGGERILSRQVEELNKGPYFKNSVDISDADIIIPEGKELYIGYGSPSSNAGFRIGTVYPAPKGNSFYSAFNLDYSSWKDMYVKNLGIYMDVALTGTMTEQLEAQDLTQLGYSYIEPLVGPWQEGEKFPLILHAAPGVTSHRWTLDGEPVTGDSIILETGTKVLQAHLKYDDGRTETLEVILKIN